MTKIKYEYKEVTLEDFNKMVEGIEKEMRLQKPSIKDYTDSLMKCNPALAEAIDKALKEEIKNFKHINK